MRSIQIISVNHETHDSQKRIELDLREERWKQLFAYMKYTLGVEGYALLRTCNRIEVYFESDRDLSKDVIDKWVSLANNNAIHADHSFQTFVGYKASIEHLLQLSAGFKSAIYGDDQILSQLKNAFEAARKQKSMSTLLERAYQSIMRFHKQICRETDFKSHTVSLAYQALKSARYRFGSENLQNKNVLIIGAGDMAAQVVKYMPKFKFGSVSITNRTQSKADLLATNTSITVLPYQDLNVNQFDVIISCTDHGFDLIKDWSAVEYYIDLSLHSANLTNIEVSHILLNQLQESINQQNKIRMKSVDKVHLLMEGKVEEYVGWCMQWRERSALLNATI